MILPAESYAYASPPIARMLPLLSYWNVPVSHVRFASLFEAIRGAGGVVIASSPARHRSGDSPIQTRCTYATFLFARNPLIAAYGSVATICPLVAFTTEPPNFRTSGAS